MNIALWNKGRISVLDSESSENKDIFNCINDDHLPLVTGLDNELNIYLYCLQCNFKKTIGLQTYERVVKYAETPRME